MTRFSPARRQLRRPRPGGSRAGRCRGAGGPPGPGAPPPPAAGRTRPPEPASPHRGRSWARAAGPRATLEHGVEPARPRPRDAPGARESPLFLLGLHGSGTVQTCTRKDNARQDLSRAGPWRSHRPPSRVAVARPRHLPGPTGLRGPRRASSDEPLVSRARGARDLPLHVRLHRRGAAALPQAGPPRRRAAGRGADGGARRRHARGGLRPQRGPARHGGRLGHARPAAGDDAAGGVPGAGGFFRPPGRTGPEAGAHAAAAAGGRDVRSARCCPRSWSTTPSA